MGRKDIFIGISMITRHFHMQPQPQSAGVHGEIYWICLGILDQEVGQAYRLL